MDSGDQFAFRLARTPYSAAMCIGKNAKARAGVAAEERTLGDSGMEVVVRGSGTTLAVAKIVRTATTGTGSLSSPTAFSTVDVLVGKSVPGDRAEFARTLVSGC